MLRTLPDESVHCVVTSPPYWGLRDYGVAGQLGLERSLGEHVETMRDVFLDVRRVLRSDGTLWLNYGDSYAGSTMTGGNNGINASGGTNGFKQARQFDRKNESGLKPKDLCGIPWRVAFALQESGWWLRQDIIWSKPNPMPESIKDRCTKAHEYIFLMTKSERYHYDADAIRQEPTGRVGIINFGKTTDLNGKAHSAGFKPDGTVGANRRSVWEVATHAYSDAHFATFPPALIEPCILAGCPAGGTVLDPFGGAGTTGLVADRLQRNAILIELNPAYAAMAKNRIANDAGMFGDADYSGQADFAASLDVGYAEIRARQANGGPGWERGK
jgi:DNA modification methylase